MSIAEMKVELEELKDQRPIIERKIEDANKSYKGGLIGVLIGFFLIPVYGLGLLLIIAGGLATITQAGKRSGAKRELEQLNEQIKTLRREIAIKEEGENAR